MPMSAQEFAAMLMEGGLDQETANRLTTNDKITSRLSQFRQATEYSAIEQRANALASEKAALETSYARAKSYEDWYGTNYEAVRQNAERVAKLEKDIVTYEASFGKITAGAAPAAPVGIKQEDVDKIVADAVQKRYSEQYAPAVVSTMTGIGSVLEEHMRRGRKQKINWKELDKLAAQTNGDIDKAYELWDAPNVEEDHKLAATKAEEDVEKRIKTRVDEELKRRNVSTNFPAGADGGATGASSPLSRDRQEKSGGGYNRNMLLESWNSVQ
jgi:hypothetical protein